MASSELFEIKPSVLQWAREAAGLPLEEVARRLNVSQDAVAGWEREGIAFGVTRLRELAAIYRRPLSVLLRSAPPESVRFPTDFRTVGGREPKKSSQVLAALKRARLVQRAMGNLPRGQFTPVSLGNAKLTEPPQDVGERERQRLGLTTEAQLNFASSNSAFNAWRGRIQAQGVMVLVERMSREDCRGFALWDDAFPPAAVVCNDEGDEAKTFTALHEYGHLLLRSSAACLEIESANGSLGSTERWCNRLAGVVLASEEAIRAAMVQTGTPSYVTNLNQVTSLARRLHVSRHVVALRLEELGLAPSGLYQKLLPQLNSDGNRPPIAEDDDIRISSVRRAASELGFLPTLAVLSAVASGAAGPADAAWLLGVPASKLPELRTEVERLRSNHGGPLS